MQKRERKLGGETRKRRGKCKTSSQNSHGKTETCSHIEHILAVHVAPNLSDIKSS